MRILLAAALIATLATSATPLLAQSNIEGRVDRLEREMRAVQRKVFPGGGGQLFTPDITPPEAARPGVPAESPVIDLTARVTALESQVTTMTGQIEQTQFRLRQLEEAFNAYRRTTDARLRALEEGASTPGGAAGPGASTPGGAVTAGPAPAPASTPPRAATPPAERPAATGTPPAPRPAASSTTTAPIARPNAAPDRPTAAARPDPARATAVAAIERPSTGDAAEDAYVYGFRLWSARFYPEAQRQLREMVRLHPNHRRASYAQNLLGRAFLDNNQPSQAAIAFYENYQKNPNGERAADSLYYLAVALKRLNKPAAEVCRVYAELTDVYGTRLSDQLRADVAAGKAASNCR